MSRPLTRHGLQGRFLFRKKQNPSRSCDSRQDFRHCRSAETLDEMRYRQNRLNQQALLARRVTILALVFFRGDHVLGRGRR
ncbi:MAG: hypothetical protein ACI87E_002167 [Mariniblastus sp.]|jgi:hypothetical protein